MLARNEPSHRGFAFRAMTVPIAKLSFWGVRGSTPTVDPATWRYGGNTPCLELIAPDGTQFILDCGTGLRMLGNRGSSPSAGGSPETHIFVTHYHWDHIQGELAAGADIFINDAQYTPEQLASTRRGWGHSSWREGTRIAREVGAKTLVLFHHDPDSTDRMVDTILKHAREEFDSVFAASEGMVITLGAPGERVEAHMPGSRTALRREAHFRARVCGVTEGGHAFEEDTIVKDLSLQGALISLKHSPRLQSELQVTMETPGVNGMEQMQLRGYVVRIDGEAEKGQTSVGVVFTD